MSIVAVISHSRKNASEIHRLHDALSREGIAPIWHDVQRSRDAPDRVRDALEAGADLIFARGGDGMVQRCAGALSHANAALAIVPAGTANLFASSLKIPKNVDDAVAIGLHGRRRLFDLGRLNGEHFAVFAGAGFDAWMVGGARRKLKNRWGRAAYLWSGLKSLGRPPFRASVRVDGTHWYDGKATCVLLGNIGSLSAAIHLFEGARPDDGVLELGVVTAEGRIQWIRTLARTFLGDANRSQFVRMTRGRSIDIRLNHGIAYELDGGVRKKTRAMHVAIEPAALTVCVPRFVGAGE
jgi:diacylglycerol kinase (ATP)